MSAIGVHRLIEQQTARRGDHVAIAGRHLTLTYRELNLRANAVARDLMARGLRRGAHAVVRLECGPELAILLLAVLKAGAAYSWIDPASPSVYPYGVSLLETSGWRPLVVNPMDILARCTSAPNLPIVTRAEDIACVLPQRDGMPGVLVPHASIASLAGHPVPDCCEWIGRDASALDLWLPLLAGSTVTTAAPAVAAAA